MEGKSLIKVFKTKRFFYIVEYTVQFIPWTKTKFSNLSVLDNNGPVLYMGVSNTKTYIRE